MVKWNQQSQLPTTESTTNENSTIDSAIHNRRRERNSDFIKNDKWRLKMISFLSIKHTVNSVIISYIVYNDICLMVRKKIILFYFIITIIIKSAFFFYYCYNVRDWIHFTYKSAVYDVYSSCKLKSKLEPLNVYCVCITELSGKQEWNCILLPIQYLAIRSDIIKTRET